MERLRTLLAAEAKWTNAHIPIPVQYLLGITLIIVSIVIVTIYAKGIQ